MTSHNSCTLITGGNGFIGANLIRRLLKSDIAVHCIIRQSSDLWRLQDIKNRINFHTVALTDIDRLRLLIRKINPEYVFHFAAYGNSPDEKDIDTALEVNIRATSNLIRATLDTPYKILVNTGSSSEYGRSDKSMRITDLPVPESIYAATKAASTLITGYFARTHRKPIVTVRPFSVYGPYEEKYRLVPQAVLSLLHNRPIRLSGGVVRHDFIYIDDFIDVYLRLMKVKKVKPGMVINAGAGQEFTNREVVDTLFRATRHRTEIETGSHAGRIWDVPHWKADISETKKMLSWKPTHSLAKGLAKTYAWFARHGSLYGK